MASLVGGSCQPGSLLLTMLYLQETRIGLSETHGVPPAKRAKAERVISQDLSMLSGTILAHPACVMQMLLHKADWCMLKLNISPGLSGAHSCCLPQSTTLRCHRCHLHAEDGHLDLEWLDQAILVVVHLVKHLHTGSHIHALRSTLQAVPGWIVPETAQSSMHAGRLTLLHLQARQ